MREAHPRERTVGIEWYASDADGVGGRLRDRPTDFRVHELEAFATEPADADAGDYPYLVLRATLTGWDTNDFAGRLSDALSMSRERVDWAGTKDKHAVTTQLFSIYDAEPEDLPEIRNAKIEVVGRAGRHLSYGDLAGNAFEITVRDPEHAENADEITEQLRAFAGDDNGDRAGVPNIFGHQRFGSRRPVTHEVGLHIVRGEWRGAVLSYVGNPFDTEPEDTQAARGFVDKQAASDDPDWDACLDRMPGKLGYERSMLHRLRERDAGSSDPSAGGEQETEIPESRGDSGASQTQSDDGPWRYALEAVPSNLQRLFVNAAQSYAFNRILSERLERGLPFDHPVTGDVCCFADTSIEAIRKPDPDRIQRATENRVDVLTRHCERGRAFVTAPLIGTETEFAEGEPGEIERTVFDELGLEPSMFSLPGEFDSTGTRRAVLVDSELTVSHDPLTFEFSLPSGSYATAVLREYLKTDPVSL